MQTEELHKIEYFESDLPMRSNIEEIDFLYQNAGVILEFKR